MGFNCSVPECPTNGLNKGSRKNPSGISMHRFPSDDQVCAQWVEALNRPNWWPKTQSRVCSIHFQNSDFIEESQDQQTRRKKRKFLQGQQKLKRRRLRNEAVPTIFPIQYPPSTTKLDEPDFEGVTTEDFVCSFEDLLEFADDASLPEEVSVIKKPDSIVFMGTEKMINGRFRVIFQLSVFKDCSFQMQVQNTVCNQSVVNDITHGRCIKFPSQILDILSILKSKSDSFFKLESNVEVLVRDFQQNLSKFRVDDKGMQSKIQAIQYQIYSILPPKPQPTY